MQIEDIASLLKTKILNSSSFKLNKDYFFVAAAAITKKRDILSIGFNSYTKTHPKMLYYSSKVNNYNRIYLHAEISALVKSKKPVWGLVIVRVLKNKSLALSKPCPTCQLAIKEAGCKFIWYTNNKSSLIIKEKV
jgi:deoxycytidylate deaminase